jgi:hypothetical protein
MHHALYIPEVVALIILYVKPRHRRRQGDSNLAALARTCHAFSDPALDELWEEPSLWYLAKTMSENLWRIEINDTEIPSGSVVDLDDMDHDAQHILVRARATAVCITN